MKKFGKRGLLSIGVVALIALTACGSSPEAAEPTPSATPKAVATFQTVKVTAVPEGTPTPVPTIEVSTRGKPRDFPELLKQGEGVSTGSGMAKWQAYLDNAVMLFDGEAWDLCEGGRGLVDSGELKGDILWSIAPATAELKSNELLLYAYSFEKDAGRGFVTGYENDAPVLKPIVGRSLYSTDPIEFAGDPIPFEMYELKECLNIQTLRTP
jgi:hypothetical protein